MTIPHGGTEYDMRVSSLPGVGGEKIVIRILDKDAGKWSLDNVVTSPEDNKKLRELMSNPYGMMLLTGPTGSGKSTTLYSLLERIKDGKRKIVTIEDPVEYQLAGVTQIQVKEDIGYTFANALRATLRQDPDIIMIGEIRDRETAEIAIQASLTGHLVLSTLHTNNAVSAFTRLIDMGVEPFLVASSVQAVMAQRLVRRLCPKCAESYELAVDIVDLLGESLGAGQLQEEPTWLRAAGCDDCGGIGYKGRVGVYELVNVTPEMHSLIVNMASTEELWRLAASQGAKSLRQDGLLKAQSGDTSIEEVLRVTAD